MSNRVVVQKYLFGAGRDGSRPLEQVWFHAEKIRREKNGLPNLPALVSYPRSGSHLLRIAIEMLSGRPTLGDGDGTALRPLWQPDWPPSLRSVRFPWTGAVCPPLLQKVHYLESTGGRLDAALRENKLHVFLVREPLQALIAHLRHEPDTSFRARCDEEVKRFSENVGFMAALAPEQRLVVRYEQLIESPVEQATTVLNFLAVRPHPIGQVAFSDARLRRLGRRAVRRPPGSRYHVSSWRISEVQKRINRMDAVFRWLESQ